MEPILIKKHGKTQYTFFVDSIQKVRGNKTINVNLGDIREITYNEKFTIADCLLMLFAGGTGMPWRFPKSFMIFFKSINPPWGFPLKKEEYLILKEKFQMPIQLV